MKQAENLEELMKIRAHNRSLLDSFNGNLGTALGFKKYTGDNTISQEPAILVFVPVKINPKWIPGSQLIPKKLEHPDDLWCPLDVVEGGKAETEDPVPEDVSEIAEALRGWSEYVWPGSQISHWVDPAEGRYSTGTLGAFVRDRMSGEPGLLTNQHVGIEPGKKLYHPVPWGTHVATTLRTELYVEDQHWYGPYSDEPRTYVRIDCAFAPLTGSLSSTDINPELLSVGKMGPVLEIDLKSMDIIGQKVIRLGPTTGLRKGTVVAFGYEFLDNGESTVYTDLLIVGEPGKPFSAHGDSGSIIVTDDDNLNPAGLLWGGWQEKLRTGFAQENWSYGIALSRVLDVLNIEIIY